LILGISDYTAYQENQQSTANYDDYSQPLAGPNHFSGASEECGEVDSQNAMNRHDLIP
jgi:hypothetical protein